MSEDKRIQELKLLGRRFHWELEQGSADVAADICRRLVHEWTDVEGADGETVLAWRGGLGRALTEARRFKEAERVLTDLLVDRLRLFGPLHPKTLTTRGNLARAIARGGHPAEAIEIAKDLLETRIQVLGPDDPSTLDTRGNIAQFHDLLGNFETAVLMLEELLQDRTRVLGDDHPDTENTRYNLHVIRSRSGRSDDLTDLHAYARELLEDLGPDNLNVMNIFGILCEALEDKGRLEDSLEISRQIFDARSRVLGEGDARTLVTRRRIARLLVILGQIPEAISELLRIVELHSREDRLDDVDCTEAMEEIFRIVYECRKSPPRSDATVLDESPILSTLVAYRNGLSAGTARERIDQWIAAVGAHTLDDFTDRRDQ